MVSEQSEWDFSRRGERSFSGAQSDERWDEWDEFELGLPEDEFRDAFELDDSLEDPEPEYGDFWPDMDDEEEA